MDYTRAGVSWVKPQLCQLKLKKTHDLLQDIYKKDFIAS